MSVDLAADLSKLHMAGGRGNVGGVWFDFTDPLINGMLVPIHTLDVRLGEYAEGIYAQAPRISFPWDPVDADFRKAERKKLAGTSLARDYAEFGPHGSVEIGDKLFIYSVRPVHVGSEFDHDFESYIYKVRYKIQKPDGSEVRVHSYSIYLPIATTQIFTEKELGVRAGLDAASVEQRLRVILNDANLEYDNGPTSAWEYNAGICKLALIHVANLDQSTTDSSERTSHDVARDSALIEAGYYLAKAESEVRIAPIAKKARHSQRVASQARRKLTDPIREAAQMYIDANPNTSKSECARWVAERVGKTSRHVERIIGPLFTPRNSKSAVNELRPKIVRR